MAEFGRELGIAFQVADDVLDYTANSERLGKNVGDDLAEGKPTLPLILCRRNLPQHERYLIDNTIRQGSLDQLERITELITTSGALRRCSFNVIITDSVGLSVFMARRVSQVMALVLGKRRNDVHGH